MHPYRYMRRLVVYWPFVFFSDNDLPPGGTVRYFLKQSETSWPSRSRCVHYFFELFSESYCFFAFVDLLVPGIEQRI